MFITSKSKRKSSGYWTLIQLMHGGIEVYGGELQEGKAYFNTSCGFPFGLTFKNTQILAFYFSIPNIFIFILTIKNGSLSRILLMIIEQKKLFYKNIPEK